MTNEEILAARAATRTFTATPAGRAMVEFERTLGTAWTTDQREGVSDARLQRDWDAADAARKELRERIGGLQAALAAARAVIAEDREVAFCSYTLGGRIETADKNERANLARYDATLTRIDAALEFKG